MIEKTNSDDKKVKLRLAIEFTEDEYDALVSIGEVSEIIIKHLKELANTIAAEKKKDFIDNLKIGAIVIKKLIKKRGANTSNTGKEKESYGKKLTYSDPENSQEVC